MKSMNNNTLTIMVGLPRSGKSTWIELNKGDAVVVSSDWIREHILGDAYSYSSSANAIVWSLADAALRIVLGQGMNAILDGVNLTRATRKFYVDIAREYGAKVNMVVVGTSVEACLKRNQLPGGLKLPDEKLMKMSKSIEWPIQDECDEIVMAPCNMCLSDLPKYVSLSIVLKDD